MLADRGMSGGKPMAIVLVEQYYDFAAELADQYLVMERGEVVQRGRGKDMEAEGARQRMSFEPPPRRLRRSPSRGHRWRAGKAGSAAVARQQHNAGLHDIQEPSPMITVHHLENSRSQRVLWLLEELGLPYEIQHYQRDPKTSLAPAALRQVHPLGKSPVITDDGRVVAESGAIIEYLVERHGNGRLAPPPGSDERLR